MMKTFVVQRHEGRHGPSVHPDPEDWSTPHVGFANTNMLSLLPASQDNSGKTDVLHTLYVGDDVNGEVEKVEALELWFLLHDCNLGDYLSVSRYEQPPAAEAERIDRAVIHDWYIPERKEKTNQPFGYNAPPLQGVEKQVEVRINNMVLATSNVRNGCWFSPWPPSNAPLEKIWWACESRTVVMAIVPCWWRNWNFGSGIHNHRPASLENSCSHAFSS